MTRWTFWVAQLALAGLVVWSGTLLYRQTAAIDGELHLDVTWLAVTIAVKTATIWISALKFRELSRLVGLKLRTSEWFGLSVIPTFQAYISPAQTGHIFRAIYLRARHDFKYHRYAATTVAVTLLEAAVAALIGLILTVALFRGPVALSGFFAITLVCLCAGPFVLLAAARSRFAQGREWVSELADRVARSLTLIASTDARVLRLTALCASSVIARWVGLYGSFRACGFDVNALHILAVESVRTVASMINVTPANIGIAEGVIAGTATLFGVPAAESIPAAVVSRLIAMSLYIALGLWFTKSLFGTLIPRLPGRTDLGQIGPTK